MYIHLCHISIPDLHFKDVIKAGSTYSQKKPALTKQDKIVRIDTVMYDSVLLLFMVMIAGIHCTYQYRSV